MPSHHIPVLLNETLQIMQPHDDEIYIDATFGAGGHSAELLKAAKCTIHATDRDASTQQYAETLSLQYPGRFHWHQSKFSELPRLFESISKPVSGVLFDIGVSSMQLDQEERGFSFMREGPLSMTMGKNEMSAYEIVNHWSQKDLVQLLIELGEETKSNAHKISTAICDIRKRHKLTTTKELSDLITKVIERRGRLHPATKTFQAIRMTVNDELRELELGIQAACSWLKVGGKVCVITFNGLENKILKKVGKDLIHKPHRDKYQQQSVHPDRNKVHESSQSSAPLTNSGSSKSFAWLYDSPIRPSRKELALNPRARSAQCRVITRVS